MQYSRQQILEEIKKIFAEGPPINQAALKQTAASDSSSSGPKGATAAAGTSAGTAASKSKPAGDKSTEDAKKAAAARKEEEKAKAAAMAARIADMGGNKFWARLDNEYEVKVKTVMALQNRNWWNKPDDWDDEYYEETGKFSAKDKDSPGESGALDYDTTAAEPDEAMYRRQGYSQVYQNVRRVLMRPGAVDYQSAAAENLVQQVSLIKPRIPYFINVSHNMHSKRVTTDNKNSRIMSGMTGRASSGAPQQVFFHKHPLNDAKNKKLVVKTIERSLAPAKEGGEFVIGIPYFYWPNYGSGVGAPVTTNSEFAVICLYPMFASDKYASKERVIVRAIPFRTRQSIALGIGAAFYNWTWAEGFGDKFKNKKLPLSTVQQGDENKYKAMTNLPGEFSVMASQFKIINDKIDGHKALLKNFIKHLNKSIADKQVVSDCTKIVKNYVSYLGELRKHTIFLAASSGRKYQDMATHWIPLINYGGIISDAQKALWPGAQKALWPGAQK